MTVELFLWKNSFYCLWHDIDEISWNWAL